MNFLPVVILAGLLVIDVLYDYLRDRRAREDFDVEQQYDDEQLRRELRRHG